MAQGNDEALVKTPAAMGGMVVCWGRIHLWGPCVKSLRNGEEGSNSKAGETAWPLLSVIQASGKKERRS